MKKADMEAASIAYQKCMNAAKAFMRQGLLGDGLESATRALEHVDGMMRYEEKYAGASFNSVACIDLILATAPVVLDRKSLGELENLLRARKRIEKRTDEQLLDGVEDAKGRLFRVYEILDWIEQEQEWGSNGSSEDSQLLHSLESAGIVTRTHDKYQLTTCLSDTWKAKCWSCGAVVSGQKRKFLGHAPCPRCKARSEFAILGRVQGDTSC